MVAMVAAVGRGGLCGGAGGAQAMLDPWRAPVPALYRATNCLRNENIVPVNSGLHCNNNESSSTVASALLFLPIEIAFEYFIRLTSIAAARRNTN
jgi:hypothetical protein